MSVVPIFSVAGAPGVTSVACLLASTWDQSGPVAVIECDPSGGDLAPRFGLSTTIGWPSLISAVRRTGSSTPVAPHLQHLPGGLPVLIGAVGGTPMAADTPEAEAVRNGIVGADGHGLVVIDLGRLPHGPEAGAGWLESGSCAVLVARDDPAAAVRVRSRAAELLERTGGRVGLVLVGGTAFSCRELADLTDLVPMGELPFDPASAAVATGASGAGRRLERSHLLASVRRVGDAVSALAGTTGEVPVPSVSDAWHLVDAGHRPTVGAVRSALERFGRRPRVDGAV